MANLQITAGRINSADSYMDVFGSCGGNSDAETEHLKRTYRQLVRVVHPDKHTGTDQLAIASQAFKKLVEWKKQADQAIKQGTYGQVPTVELVTSQFTHQIRRVVYSGDIADLSMSWTSKGKGTRTCTWFKRARAPSDNDLLEAEVRALERLRAVNTNRDFWPFFPELMESILLSEGKTREEQMC